MADSSALREAGNAFYKSGKLDEGKRLLMISIEAASNLPRLSHRKVQ